MTPEETIAALPHTRDGKPITPGMVVYHPKTGGAYTVCPFHEWLAPNPFSRETRGAPRAVHADGKQLTAAAQCFADPVKARAAATEGESG